MKLSIVLLAASMLKAQIEGIKAGNECNTKVECKVLNFMKEAINSGKGAECESKGALEDATKCQLEAFGLSKDQAELASKVYPYTSQCTPKSDTEFKTCTVGCTKQDDRDSCLENCAISLKVKAVECLEKMAGKSTSDASKNAKCMVECDKNSYSEIFDCEYNCHKDVLDALASKSPGENGDSKDSDKSTDNATKSKSSGSGARPTEGSRFKSESSEESSSYLTTRSNSLAKITMTILITSLFI
jgi:hypothetical protein